jgi:Ala-tRNA(Pro) deacylase
MNIAAFLTDQHVWFETIKHEATYDAQRTAQAVHVTGERVAKAVLLRADDAYVIAVLPATHKLDLSAAMKLLNVRRLEFATEPEFSERFPDFELGALPPFGSQYGMQTIVDESLAGSGEIVFGGNVHDEAVRMRYEDFLGLERPIIAVFSRHH